MYNKTYFKTQDAQEVVTFIKEHPFAFVTGSFLSGEQVATQIPVLLEERAGELFLQGHIMRNADHHKAFVENPHALLVFTGPSCYVSASWYSDPHVGSTWNYMSVHVTGQVQFMAHDAFAAFMQKLSLTFENGNRESPTFFDNLSPDYTTNMMRAIVGFELKVEKISHVFKLSQNRDAQSYLNIITQLEAKGGESALIAAEMQKRKAQLFPEQ